MRFWELCKPESTRKYAEWDQDVMDLEQVLCPADPAHRRGGKRLSDLNVLLPRGPIQDFVWTWQSECLIQEHVLDLFRREGFTGFAVKPVKSRFKKDGEKPPTLWELVRTGWGGLARPESGIERIRFCEACKSVKYSGLNNPKLLIDETQWDGSDFFTVWPLPLFIFITQRVVDCIRDHRLTGIALKEVQGLTGVGESGFMPGRLSYWMPETRARELGEAAGIAEV